jgi:hypothetical protein
VLLVSFGGFCILGILIACCYSAFDTFLGVHVCVIVCAPLWVF